MWILLCHSRWVCHWCRFVSTEYSKRKEYCENAATEKIYKRNFVIICHNRKSFSFLNKFIFKKKNRFRFSNLIVIDDVSCVRMVRMVPKPRKYGQWFSMYVSRLCSSQPMLHHLYSNEYSEYSKHKWTLHMMPK